MAAEMLDKEQLNIIFNLADTFRTCLIKERQIYHILKGKASEVVSGARRTEIQGFHF